MMYIRRWKRRAAVCMSVFYYNENMADCVCRLDNMNPVPQQTGKDTSLTCVIFIYFLLQNFFWSSCNLRNNSSLLREKFSRSRILIFVAINIGKIKQRTIISNFENSLNAKTKTTTTTARRSVIPMSNLLATFLPFYMDLYFVSTKLIQKNYVIRSTSRCKIKTNHDLVSRGFHAPRGVRLCFDSGSFIIVFPNCYVWSTLKISDWPYRVRTRRVGTNFKLRGTMDSTAPGV